MFAFLHRTPGRWLGLAAIVIAAVGLTASLMIATHTLAARSSSSADDAAKAVVPTSWASSAS